SQSYPASRNASMSSAIRSHLASLSIVSLPAAFRLGPLDPRLSCIAVAPERKPLLVVLAARWVMAPLHISHEGNVPRAAARPCTRIHARRFPFGPEGKAKNLPPDHPVALLLLTRRSPGPEALYAGHHCLRLIGVFERTIVADISCGSSRSLKGSDEYHIDIAAVGANPLRKLEPADPSGT